MYNVLLQTFLGLITQLDCDKVQGPQQESLHITKHDLSLDTGLA
jgi:hypothetical protein